MASEQPLLQEEPQESSCKHWVKSACKTLGKWLVLALVVIFVLAWAVQGIVYEYATIGCKPAKLGDDYPYPGGGTNAAGGPDVNLIPIISLLAERKPMWYGDAFDVIPSNEASSVAGAPVGTWWRTIGPLFNTYVYEDVANSQPTIMMRRKLLRLGQCHVIERCDGLGDVYTFSEGSNFFANRFRRWLGMNQAMSYKIYKGNTLVAVAEETQNGFESMTLRNTTSRREIGSSVLKMRHFHGQFDMWLVDNHEKAELPAYISSAATLLYAFFTLHRNKHDVKVEPHGSASHDSPTFLAKVENVSSKSAVALPQVAEAGIQAAAESAPDQLI